MKRRRRRRFLPRKNLKEIFRACGESAEAPPVADTARRFRGSGGRIAREDGQDDLRRDGGRTPAAATPPGVRCKRYFLFAKRKYPLPTRKKRLLLFANLRLRCLRITAGQKIAAFSPPNTLGHPHVDTPAATRPLSLPRCVSGCNANKLLGCRTAAAAVIDAEKVSTIAQERQLTTARNGKFAEKPFSFGCPEGYFLFGKRKYLFGFDGRRRSRRGRPSRPQAHICVG